MTDFLSAKNAIARITVQGQKVEGHLAAAVIGAPGVSFSTTQVSQIELSVRDEDFRLLRAGLFSAGSPFTFDGERLEVAVVETGGTVSPRIGVKARSRGVQVLKREKGEKVWSSISPTDLVRQSAERVGLDFKGQSTEQRASISRAGADSKGNEAESQWDLMRDLAAEEGFLLFEAAGVLHFAKPTWLLDNADTTWNLGFPDRGKGKTGLYPMTIPVCRRSANDDDEAVEISFSVPWDDGIRIRPGHAVSLVGIPSFRGTYLVDSVSFSVDGRSPVEVSASTPVDPDPREAAADPVSDDLGVSDFLSEGTPDYGDPQSDVSIDSPALGTGEMIWPVRGVITSNFGPRNGKMHRGIDIGGNDRQRIVAAADGVVTRAAYSDSYGWVVYLDHRIDGNPALRSLETRYAHMHSKPVVSSVEYVGGAAIFKEVKVKKGQTLGYVGSTGRSTGPHLHFEVRHRSSGGALDPRDYLSGNPPKVNTVPPNVR